MVYKLRKELVDGKPVKLSLGMPEVDAYLKFLEHRCRPNTWLSYGYDLQIFLNTIAKPVREVTSMDILTFIESQRATPRLRTKAKRSAPSDSGLASRTIRRRLTTIAGLYEYLRVFEGIALKDNPVPRGLTRRNSFWGNHYFNVSVMPLIRTPQTLPRPLENEEINRFVDSLRNHRDKAIVLLMLLAGLRKSEVLNLRLGDVHFGRRTLFVRDGKGGRQRLVAISDTGLKELLCYMDKERPPNSSGHIFLVLKGPHRGHPLKIKALDTIVWYHKQQVNTPGVQCHRLRHTCFTRLRQGGTSLEALQAQAGHASIATTRVYLHLCPKELQQEYSKLSETVFGFLGPNGAGKTTTIRMLTGLSRPTDGGAHVLGYDIASEIIKAKKAFGVVPEQSNMYDELSGLGNLIFMGQLYGIHSHERQPRVEELLRASSLYERKDSKFATYSRGMKRALTIAAALVHKPRLLFLDEPTVGLDVGAARSFSK